jgi:ribosomal protein L11 methylase PrmA
MMKWYSIQVNVPLSLLEASYNFLWQFINGIKVKKRDRSFLITGYLFSDYPDTILKRFEKSLKIHAKSYHIPYPQPSLKEILRSSSNEFIIVPVPSSLLPPFGVTIQIQRGRAFGIGSHPCTVYCLQALRDLFEKKFGAFSKKSILDAGTGSGILSIAAAKLGGTDITGIDINPEALYEGCKNAELNQVTQTVKILCCSVKDVTEKFNMVVANLYGSLLVEIASSLAETVTLGGYLILGGMNILQRADILSTYARFGLTELTSYHDDEWNVSVMQKNKSDD